MPYREKTSRQNAVARWNHSSNKICDLERSIWKHVCLSLKCHVCQNCKIFVFHSLSFEWFLLHLLALFPYTKNLTFDFVLMQIKYILCMFLSFRNEVIIWNLIYKIYFLADFAVIMMYNMKDSLLNLSSETNCCYCQTLNIILISLLLLENKIRKLLNTD